MEYLTIAILVCIGTSIVLYFAYIRQLKEEVNFLLECLEQSLKDTEYFEKQNQQLRKNGMYKVKKVGRPRKEK